MPPSLRTPTTPRRRTGRSRSTSLIRPADQGSIDHARIAALGLVTIACYGAWYYAFGVLIEPIATDTGWTYSALSASFAVGQVMAGIGSLFGGMLLDRAGSRAVFGLGGVLGVGALFGVAAADAPVVFGVFSAIAFASFGSLCFYHVTMTAAVRVNPDNPDRAIATLTLWGALASAIYLPAAAWLVESFGWRPTVRILAVSAGLALMLGIATVRVEAQAEAQARLPIRRALHLAWASAAPRRFSLAVLFSGVAIASLLIYQVPIMVSAGLPLTTAASIAGARGFAQLGGRLPLGLILDRVPARRAFLGAIAAIAIGSLVLPFSSTWVVGVGFAVIAGFGIGAHSPLQGVYAEQLFDRASLGTTMGLTASTMMVGGAVGSVVSGRLTDLTGSPRPGAFVAAAAAAAAMIALTTGHPRPDCRPPSTEN